MSPISWNAVENDCITEIVRLSVKKGIINANDSPIPRNISTVETVRSMCLSIPGLILLTSIKA